MFAMISARERGISSPEVLVAGVHGVNDYGALHTVYDAQFEQVAGGIWSDEHGQPLVVNGFGPDRVPEGMKDRVVLETVLPS